MMRSIDEPSLCGPAVFAGPTLAANAVLPVNLSYKSIAPQRRVMRCEPGSARLAATDDPGREARATDNTLKSKENCAIE